MANLKKEVVSKKEFLKENKKQVIVTGVLTLSLLITLGISSVLRSSFKEALDQVNADTADVKTETVKLKDAINENTSNQLAAKAEAGYEYIGAKIDTGLWQADDQYFWKFMEPAFSFKNGDEYNKMRQGYIDQLGNCLFTNNVLAPFDKDMYDNPAEANDAMRISGNSFKSYPMALDDDGYRYLGVIEFASAQAYKDVGNNTMLFTYKIRHVDDMNVTIEDFECYPVHARGNN